MGDTEIQEKPTDDMGTGEMESGKASIKPPGDSPRLSPLNQALCISVIWVFIFATPALLLYNYNILLLWIPAGVGLEDHWRKKYGVYYVPRRFVNWLMASWFGEMFVRRCYIGSKAALRWREVAQMGFMVGGLAFFAWFNAPPTIELKEMRVVNGTLSEWKRTARKGGCGDIITVRRENGNNEKFYRGVEKEDFYRQMIGQEVTVWVQPNSNSIVSFHPNCRKFDEVTQLEHEGRVLGLPYDKERYDIVPNFIHYIAKIFIWTGVFGLLMVWRINRRKNALFNENN